MITTICRVLLHSLWQGLAMAVLAGFLLLFTQRSSPALRYRLLTGLLALFAAGIVATSVWLSQDATQSGSAAPAAGVCVNAAPVRVKSDVAGALPGIEAYATWLVWLWLLVVCLKTVRLGAGLWTAWRMKAQKVYDAGSHWQQRTAELARRLGVRRKIRVVESALAKTPMLIGHLKPVVLMPLGLICRLPAAEVEAILCHELAHARRKDFLVNLLQSLLEVFFFFNPAVLWLNRLIRTEREHCCDDLALGASVTVRDYVSALVASYPAGHGGSAFALSFTGTDHQPLERVSRLLRKNDGRRHRPFRTALPFLLLSAAACLAFFWRGSNNPEESISRTRTTTITTTTESPGSIAKSELSLREEQFSRPAHEGCTPAPPPILIVPGGFAATSPPAETSAASEISLPGRRTGVVRELTAGTAAASGEEAQEEGHDGLIEQECRMVLSDLSSDGLISGTPQEGVSYLLSDRELIVNYVKQPEPLHEKYKAKYAKYPGRTLLYNYEYARLN